MEDRDIRLLREKLMAGGFAEEDKYEDEVSTNALDEFLKYFNKEDSPLRMYDWKAYVPSHLLSGSLNIPLYGIIQEESESIYLIDAKSFSSTHEEIGYIAIAEDALPDEKFDGNAYYLKGFYENDALTLKLVDSKRDLEHYVRIEPYDETVNLFSRNKGLLESENMLGKRIVLVGCGSVGSFAAMEFARSGVGKFVLVDTDTLEIHNICRHQCGFDDLGRYKVNAVKDKILNINPKAEVITFKLPIQRIPDSEILPLLGKDTLIYGGGDNRGSSAYACELAVNTGSAFVAASCWTRAFAGEIFYWIPDKDMPCYTCAFKEMIDDERPEEHAAYFGESNEIGKLSFEPGIAADIDFVNLIGIKVALDLLNRDNDSYTPRVTQYLKQYTWICNSNDIRIGGERAGIFPHPLFISNNLSIAKDPNCPCCGGRQTDKE